MRQIQTVWNIEQNDAAVLEGKSLHLDRGSTFILLLCIALIALGFFIPLKFLTAPKLSTSYQLPTTGIAIASNTVPNMSGSPLQPIPVDLIISAAELVAILVALTELLRWAEWKAKYHKVRTPISIRSGHIPKKKNRVH